MSPSALSPAIARTNPATPATPPTRRTARTLGASQEACETSAVSDEVFDLSTNPAHLGLGARVERLGAFDGSPDWYMRYGEAHVDDGLEGRLVSMHTFDAPWSTWEMH